MQIELTENEAQALITLLGVLPYYTEGKLPIPYEQARKDWILKIGALFPSFIP